MKQSIKYQRKLIGVEKKFKINYLKIS